MKLVVACRSTRKDRNSSFHHCEGHVNLVEACLNARKDRESSFPQIEGSIQPL